ncbi:MAG TPA: DUF3576 domain-containing protein [Stellaceae bacterium]|nr:DUF3576 domain-containing protein [Stellaceae bacterium]
MSVRHYGLLLGLVASLSFGLAGCSGDRAASGPPDTVAGAAQPQVAAQTADNDSTDQTLWTWIGLAKLPSHQNPGPQTGTLVSPVLWEAAHDVLHFAGVSSEDPVTGLLVTKWYSPPGKPDERLRISVFILSRALRSDSVAVTVERDTRAPGGPWHKAPVARGVPDGIDFAILTQAQRIHAVQYREAHYGQ